MVYCFRSARCPETVLRGMVEHGEDPLRGREQIQRQPERGGTEDGCLHHWLDQR